MIRWNLPRGICLCQWLCEQIVRDIYPEFERWVQMDVTRYEFWDKMGKDKSTSRENRLNRRDREVFRLNGLAFIDGKEIPIDAFVAVDTYSQDFCPYRVGVVYDGSLFQNYLIYRDEGCSGNGSYCFSKDERFTGFAEWLREISY